MCSRSVNYQIESGCSYDSYTMLLKQLLGPVVYLIRKTLHFFFNVQKWSLSEPGVRIILVQAPSQEPRMSHPYQTVFGCLMALQHLLVICKVQNQYFSSLTISFLHLILYNYTNVFLPSRLITIVVLGYLWLITS